MCDQCEDVLRDGHGPTYAILLEHLREMDADVQEPNDPLYELWKLLSKASVTSLESFSEPILEMFREKLRKHPGLWHAVVEDHYLREAFNRIPGILKRVRRLPALTINRVPADELRHFLNEATRCFVYGFFQASVALSRAALESAFNDSLREKFPYVPNVDLSQKIKKAAQFKLVSAESAFEANRVRIAANRVLHDQPASEEEALQSLVHVRGVIAELYGA